MTDLVITELVSQCILRMSENTTKLTACLEELNEDQIWLRPNDHSNSIGNLILHLCGNITQYIISSLGEAEDLRERDKEFTVRGGLNKQELLYRLQETLAEAYSIMKRQNLQQLLKIRSVQGFHYSGIGILIHVTEHYSYHTGQMAFWTKILKDKDLGFYAGIDLNQKNR